MPHPSQADIRPDLVAYLASQVADAATPDEAELRHAVNVGLLALFDAGDVFFDPTDKTFVFARDLHEQ